MRIRRGSFGTSVEHAGNDEAPAASLLRFSHCLVFERPVGTNRESRVAAVGRRAADVSFSPGPIPLPSSRRGWCGVLPPRLGR